MVSLLDRELKFFFTSPLFISLELTPVILITVLKVAELLDIITQELLSVMLLAIIFYSTYFELELWRKTFLNKSVKLKVYSSSSPYIPFLMHCITSLVLLELKILILLLPYIHLLFSELQNLLMFFITIHINWLFSLSLGTILSKEVFNRIADSTASFLCILIFNVIFLLILNNKISLAPYWPIPPLFTDKNLYLPYLTAFSLMSLLLFIIAVYTNSKITKRLLLGGLSN